jgi:predicted ferric reductase
VYLAVAVAPLVFAVIDPTPGRGFLINFSVALGFVGLAMLGLQFALVARSQTVATPFGIDVVLQFHRQIAYVALLFILAHPVLLFVDEPPLSLPPQVLRFVVHPHLDNVAQNTEISAPRVYITPFRRPVVPEMWFY